MLNKILGVFLTSDLLFSARHPRNPCHFNYIQVVETHTPVPVFFKSAWTSFFTIYWNLCWLVFYKLLRFVHLFQRSTVLSGYPLCLISGWLKFVSHKVDFSSLWFCSPPMWKFSLDYLILQELIWLIPFYLWMEDKTVEWGMPNHLEIFWYPSSDWED